MIDPLFICAGTSLSLSICHVLVAFCAKKQKDRQEAAGWAVAFSLLFAISSLMLSKQI